MAVRRVLGVVLHCENTWFLTVPARLSIVNHPRPSLGELSGQGGRILAVGVQTVNGMGVESMDSNLRVVNVFLELNIDRHEVLREVEICGRVVQRHLRADKDLFARDVVVVGVVNGLDIANLFLLVEVRGVR